MNILKKYNFKLENLDCANCANKIEEALKKDESLKNVSVNFDYNVKWYYKLIRIIIGAILLLGIKSGVKVVFNMIDFIPKNILDLVRYFLMSLVGIGIFPLIFKKYEKKREK